MKWLVAGLAFVGVLIAGAILFNRIVSAPTADPEPSPSVELSGTLTRTFVPNYSDVAVTSRWCEDISGARLRVATADRTVIAQDRVSPATLRPDAGDGVVQESDGCGVDFSISVPVADTYQVIIGREVTQVYTRQQLERQDFFLDLVVEGDSDFFMQYDLD